MAVELGATPVLDSLGPYPILQLAGSVVLAAVGIVGYIYSRRAQVAPPAAPIPDTLAAQYQLREPLAQGIVTLRAIHECHMENARTLKRMEEGQRQAAIELEKSNRKAEERREGINANGKTLEEISRKLEDLLHQKARARD